MVRRRIALAAPGLVLAAFAVLVLAVKERLPDEIAIHWGPGGEPDGWASPLSFLAVFLVSGVVTWVITAAAASLGRSAVVGSGWLSGMPLGVVSFLTVLGALTLLRQMDGGDQQLPIWVLPVGVLGGLVGWWAGAALAGRPDAPPSRPVAATGGVWEGVTPTSRLLGGLGAALLLAGLVSLWIIPIGVGVIFALVGLVLIASARYRVRIDDEAVRIEGGVFGFPRVVVPMAEVASAQSSEVDPWTFGGLGIRIGARGESAVVTRKGPALQIVRTDGAVLLVSLDDPAPAVAAIEARLG